MKKLLGASIARLFALLLLCASVLAACSSAPDPQGTAAPMTNPDVADTPAIDQVSLQDSSSIYQDDDDLSLETMYLTVRQGNSMDHTNHTWADVNAHSVYYYEDLGIDRYAVEGILQVGDESGPKAGEFGYGEVTPNCTVYIRGKTSSRSPQKSYRIGIKKNDGMWRLQSTIPLNKHVYDSVRFRNKLSYDLMKTIPHMFSARTQFVHLYVKDQTTGDANSAKFVDYGLFTQVEQMNKTYLRNHGLDEFGQFYKANMFEFLRYADVIKLKTDPTYDERAFEECLEIKGNDDHSKLIAMLDDVNNLAKPIEEVFAKYFDEENYFTWLAFQMLTGNRDTTSQNFFLYSPQHGNKWYFISWDNDGAWRFGENVTFKGVQGYNYEFGVTNYWACTLHQRVLKSATLRKKLDDKVNELRKTVTKERLSQMISAYSSVTKNYLFSMPDSMYAPRDEPEYNTILKEIAKEIDYNYEMYQISLRKPMPFFLGVPEVVSGQTLYQWDASYDFNNEAITYHFTLARDYAMKDVIHQAQGLQIPQIVLGVLPAGQYFYRVTATNKSGETQTAQEIYNAEDKDFFGVKCFYVLPDGKIREA